MVVNIKNILSIYDAPRLILLPASLNIILSINICAKTFTPQDMKNFINHKFSKELTISIDENLPILHENLRKFANENVEQLLGRKKLQLFLEEKTIDKNSSLIVMNSLDF